jgi:hypothetical protein
MLSIHEIKKFDKFISYISGKYEVNKDYFNCKSRTAGLLISAHSCGNITNFSEMITGEGLTQAANLIEKINHRDTIRYVCNDNGCHLDKHVRNAAYNFNEKTKVIRLSKIQDQSINGIK